MTVTDPEVLDSTPQPSRRTRLLGNRPARTARVPGPPSAVADAALWVLLTFTGITVWILVYALFFSGIHEHRAQLRFCYESELSSHPGMTGRISVKFTIAADGSVQRADVDSSTVNDRSVERCITTRVAEWLFPKPKGGGIVVVNYPFILKASGE